MRQDMAHLQVGIDGQAKREGNSDLGLIFM